MKPEELPEFSENPKSLLPSWVEIGKRFEIARGNRKTIDIQRLSGLSSSVISRSEKGEQAPNLGLLAFYSQVENIPADLILFGKTGSQDAEQALTMRVLALPVDQRMALASQILQSLTQEHALKGAAEVQGS